MAAAASQCHMLNTGESSGVSLHFTVITQNVNVVAYILKSWTVDVGKLAYIVVSVIIFI